MNMQNPLLTRTCWHFTEQEKHKESSRNGLFGSDVEPEQQHVAVLHHILLAF